MADITLPSSPGFSAMRPIYRSSSKLAISPYNYTQQVYSWRGKLKVVEFTLPRMEAAEAQEWIDFFRLLDGFVNTFTVDISDAYPKETGLTNVEMRLADPESVWGLNPPLIYDLSFTAMEAL